MKTKKVTILCLAMIVSAGSSAQHLYNSFYTVGEKKYNPTVKVMSVSYDTLKEDSSSDAGMEQEDSVLNPDKDYSCLTIEQLECLIARYENYLNFRDTRTTGTKHHNKNILSYYTGNSHKLTLSNLVDVVEEVGLSNQLFVLAQAVLETGNFTSNVCHNYHNLFGLYDSRNKDYYRFARWEDSVIGYQKFIQYRYKGGSYLGFLRRIGYAEDPAYTNKVAKLATQIYKQLFNNP